MPRAGEAGVMPRARCQGRRDADAAFERDGMFTPGCGRIRFT
jgi:hypothetical protein